MSRDDQHARVVPPEGGEDILVLDDQVVDVGVAHRTNWQRPRLAPGWYAGWDALARKRVNKPSVVHLQKPVRCGNPTLGRFDSGAAPLVQVETGRCHTRAGPVAPVRDPRRAGAESCPGGCGLPAAGARNGRRRLPVRRDQQPYLRQDPPPDRRRYARGRDRPRDRRQPRPGCSAVRPRVRHGDGSDPSDQYRDLPALVRNRTSPRSTASRRAS
jgi:hypothetical protein